MSSFDDFVKAYFSRRDVSGDGFCFFHSLLCVLKKARSELNIKILSSSHAMFVIENIERFKKDYNPTHLKERFLKGVQWPEFSSASEWASRVAKKNVLIIYSDRNERGVYYVDYNRSAHCGFDSSMEDFILSTDPSRCLYLWWSRSHFEPLFVKDASQFNRHQPHIYEIELFKYKR